MKAILNGTNLFEKEILRIKDRYNEYVLTRLRTIWGCDENEIKILFGEEIYLHFKNSIKTKSLFVNEKNGIFTLNESGNLHADGIASDLFFL